LSSFINRHKGLRLGTKIILLILPILLTSLFINEYVSRNIFSETLTRSGQKFASYKADQLEKYTLGQWQVLLQNEFYNQERYRNAAIESVKNYILNLTNNSDELVFSVNILGEIIIPDIEIKPIDSEISTLQEFYQNKSTGWISVSLQNEIWVGHTFHFAPFQWQFFLLERESYFYRELDRIAFFGNLVIFLLILISTILISFFVNYILRPLSRVTTGIRQITISRKLDQKVQIEYSDEIGELAHEFNLMTSTLENMYNKLKGVALSEAVARKEVDIREMETLITLSSAAEHKDPETGAHTLRVGEYARMIARHMNKGEDIQKLLLYAAPLHDIGKLGIPDNILLKPGKLTVEEFDIMKSHAEIGYNILIKSRSVFLREGANIALFHHERYDGTGYPKGLKGEKIPLSGRIVCIVDVFDALVSYRPYKLPWSFDQAAEHLRSEKGKQFDPVIVDLFLDNFNEIQDIFNTHQDNLGQNV
jgi:response regulator RpfG family c-di-GMP phosphodiesterase